MKALRAYAGMRKDWPGCIETDCGLREGKGKGLDGTKSPVPPVVSIGTTDMQAHLLILKDSSAGAISLSSLRAVSVTLVMI